MNRMRLTALDVPAATVPFVCFAAAESDERIE